MPIDRLWHRRFSPILFLPTGADPPTASTGVARAPRHQAKNALHYAELRIMPTSPAKAAWEAVIAVKEAA